MTGIAAIIVKILPESPESNLDEIKKNSERALKKEGALNPSFEEKPLAFGLKVLFVKFAWPEEKDTSLIESSLEKVNGVSSVSIEDYRRAFG